MRGFLQLQELEMTFPSKKGLFCALKNINLEVAQGECLALIGHSGCGKSTLLNLIAGLLKPSSGAMYCDQRPIYGPEPERSVVFQNHNLLPWLTCAENIYLAVESVFGKAETEAQLQERVQRALEMVDLIKAADKYPNEISGGMKQRVGIARALSVEPRLLLLDEPFGALDALTRSALQDELVKIIQDLNCTAVLVTHDVDEAVFLADRIVLMSQGPGATVGKIIAVDLERPRKRLALAHSHRYQELRAEVLEFLYQKN